MPRTLTPGLLSKIPGAEAKIFDNLDALLDAMLALALGHKTMTSRWDKEKGDVEVIVWDTEPDYKALAFLIENVIGKVPSRVELTGKDGGAVQVIPWMTMDEAVRLGLRPSLALPGEATDEDTDEDTNVNITEGIYHEIDTNSSDIGVGQNAETE